MSFIQSVSLGVYSVYKSEYITPMCTCEGKNVCMSISCLLLDTSVSYWCCYNTTTPVKLNPPTYEVIHTQNAAVLKAVLYHDHDLDLDLHQHQQLLRDPLAPVAD